MANKAKFKVGQTVRYLHGRESHKIVATKAEVSYSYLLEESSGERHWSREPVLRLAKTKKKAKRRG